tara:strand:- start:443 stop:2260 length:1818 start_codon:yes stop_codon:yes gene_type:complete
MARQDYDIDDGTGAQVLADLNAVFDAVLSTNSGSGVPTYAVVGTMFLDGSNLKIKHGTNPSDITTIGNITTANLGFLSATGATMTGRLNLSRQGQSASVPALDFGTTNTGIYKENSTDSVDITVAGTRRATFNTDGLALNSTRFLQFAHTNATLNVKQVVPSSGAGDKTINIPHQNSTLLTQDDFGTNSGVTSFSKISQIFRENNTSELRISGGSSVSAGANIILYGGAHSSQANRFAFFSPNASGSNLLRAMIDASGVFFAGDVGVVTGWNSSQISFRAHRASGNCKAQFTTGGYGAGSTDGTFIGIDSNGNSVFENAEATSMKFAVNGSTRQIITSTGKVVVGLNAAASVGDGLLQVQGASGISYASFRNTGTVTSGQIFGGFNAFSGTNDVASIFARQDGATTDARLVFSTQNSGSLTSKMIITSPGHIRFFQDSSSTPGFNNTTTGAAFETAPCLHISRNDSNPTMSLNTNTNGGQMIIFRNDGVEQGSIKIQSDGSGIIIAGESDYRLKENIIDIDDGITRFKKLKPKRFNFIKAKEKNPTTFNTYDGFLAHEVSEVCPEAVIGEKDGKEMQKLDPTKLITVTVAALQELIARVEALESK